MKSRALVAVATMTAIALAATPAGATTMNVNDAVDSFDEDGKCSLREAIEAARLNKKEDGCPKGSTSRDTIKLKALTYQGTAVSTNEANNQNGDFDVTGGGPITVVGQGRTSTVLNGNASDRIFDVTAAGNLTLQKLKVNSGDVDSIASNGGNLRVVGGNLKLSSVDVTNADAVSGGGLSASSAASVTVNRGFWSSNDATSTGGGISLGTGVKATVSRVLMQDQDVASATNSAGGGAIASDGGTLNFRDSTIQASSAETTGAAHAASGAAIMSNGTLNVDRSLIRGNSTSADADNVAEHGGAVYVIGGNATITNSNLFDNDAGLGGNDGLGGGVYSAGGTTEIRFTTMDANVGSSAGDAVARAGGSITLLASIINDETDACFGAISSDGYNLSETSDANCGFGGDDLPNAATMNLGEPADNGGPTDSGALSAGSQAIDRVPKSICKEATGNRDQRGFIRPNVKQGEKQKCDSGSFEFKAQEP